MTMDRHGVERCDGDIRNGYGGLWPCGRTPAPHAQTYPATKPYYTLHYCDECWADLQARRPSGLAGRYVKDQALK